MILLITEYRTHLLGEGLLFNKRDSGGGKDNNNDALFYLADAQLKELKERQKQQLRQKAMKKGLDPE